MKIIRGGLYAGLVMAVIPRSCRVRQKMKIVIIALRWRI